MEIIGYVASFCIGLILGLTGGGGSMLAIPVLVYLFSIQVVEATAYSLIIVGITSMVGAYQRFNHSLVDLKTGLTFGIPSIIAIFITRKWLIPIIPDIILEVNSTVISKRFLILVLFSILIMGASYVMITKNIRPLVNFGKKRTFHLMLQGALVGVLTGIVGIGGGFLIVPALVFLANLPFKTAVGTTLFVIALKSMTGFLADMTQYSLDWGLLAIIVSIAVLGICTGNLCSRYLAGEKLKRSIGWFTLVVGITILIRETYLITN